MTLLKTIAVWALTILLTLFFLNVSYRKFSGNEVTVNHFHEWGYGSWLIPSIATLELIGALLLLFPVTTTSGALLLSLVLTGATYTLLSHQVWSTSYITMTALVLSMTLGYLRWNQSWILVLFKMDFK
jgi:uncharacterized membrane protein YphA (DoxX/SURF4 family)